MINEENSAGMTEATHETIAMATVPCQIWNNTYDLSIALKEGTIFPELNKPFFLGGDSNGR